MEEMELLSAMFPNECYLTDENRLVFGPVDGLELELDLPRDFPLGGANNTPRLVSVSGASVAGVESLVSRIFGDGTTATGSGGLYDDDDDDDDEGGSLFEFIQSARDLAATDQSQTQPQPQLPPPATEGKTTQIDNNNEQNVPNEESPLDEEETALLRTHLPTSLETAGFTRYGDHCFVHQKCSCEVEIAPDNGIRGIILAGAEGIDEEDLAQFVAMELSVRRYAEFGTQLLEGVRMMRHMASEAAEADHRAEENDEGGRPAVGTREDYDERCRDRLPSPEEIHAHPRWKTNGSQHSPLHINPTRRLHIYTWGDALLKKPSLKKRGSQFDINAKPLNGRGGGADTRRNALQDGRIRLNVASSLGEERGRNMLVQTLWKIETEDLSCISVFCSKGRHRSVSLALLLKMVYYPQATIEHLTIK